MIRPCVVAQALGQKWRICRKHVNTAAACCPRMCESAAASGATKAKKQIKISLNAPPSKQEREREEVKRPRSKQGQEPNKTHWQMRCMMRLGDSVSTKTNIS